MGGGSNANAITTYTQLSLQTSAQGVPISLVWGRKRIGTNIIWWNDFQEQKQGKKGGGKGGGKGSAVYKYKVAVMLGLCEGPITAIGNVWADKTLTTLSALGLTLFTGTPSQVPWSYLTSQHPDQALSYAYTAYLANSAYDLGYSPNLPNHTFEVITPLSGSLSGTPDVLMADVVSDFLTNPQYSIELPSGYIDSSSWAFYRVYCQAQRLWFSPDLTSQDTVGTILDRWARLTNTWIFWSGGALKFVPLGDSAINNGDSFTIAVQTYIPNSPGPYTISGIPTVAADGGVTDHNGVAFSSVGGAPGEGQYHYSAGTWTFSQSDAGAPVAITYTYAYAGPTYTPVSAVRYRLGYDDFIRTSPNAPPIEVERADPADSPNHVRLEIINRADQYNSAIADWQDDGLVNQFGQIDSSIDQAHEICDINVGQIVVELIGARDAYIRNTYKFLLGWEYFLLEPGDIVELNDSHIGLTNFPVRLRTLEEDEAGNWQVEAEELITGIGTPSEQPLTVQGAANAGSLDTNVDPGDVNPPAVFEPSSTLQQTGGIASLGQTAQIWIAASGGADWGGCVVYVSFDNVSFSPLGTISAAAAQGLLTVNLPSHADPDTADTLSIDTTESQVALDTDATTADADALRTLSIIIPAYTTVIPSHSECISYGSTATTGTYGFSLSYLRRGLYGTTPALHSTGDFFTRLNLAQVGGMIGSSLANTTLVLSLPVEYIGRTIFLKFCSFNRFAAGVQDLSTVATYQYTPTGAGYGGGASGAPTTPTGLTATAGYASVALGWNPNPATDSVQSYKVYRASGLSQPFGAASLLATVSSPSYVDAGLAASSAWTYFVEAVNAASTSSNTSGVNATVLAGGAGTVTSVGITSPGGTIAVTGSPVTSSGSVTVDLTAIADGDLLANTSGSSGHPVATSLSALIDHALGNTRGSILYRGASGWTSAPPGTSGYVWTSNGTGADPSWQVASGGGGGGASGLFAAQIVTPPSLSTFTQRNISSPASAVNTSVGPVILDLFGSGPRIRACTIAAPATPYSIDMLVAADTPWQSFTGWGACWTDGTKYDTALCNNNGGQLEIRHALFNTASSFNTSVDTVWNLATASVQWIRLRDDGTSIYILTSADGATWNQKYTVTKSSGFLGSSGYSNVGFFLDVEGSSGATNQPSSLTLLSWLQH